MDARRTTVYNLPPELAEHPQYEVLRELGHGGMGVVYLAKNKLMDRLEVLKVVNKALLDRPGSVERFLREIRSAAKLNHPNVVAAYSALQIGELLVFAMEYIEGEDLDALVKSRGPLPVTHACHYVQQAAIGLQHAFEKGMVHRDIKPQNLILAREGKRHIVKVLDFGLAKATREKTDDTGLTGEGQMLGTPDFIAPEQTVDAAKADIRADIYSLGCTLYFLLTGAPPFRGKSLGAVILAHQSMEARPLNLVRPEVPEELAAVVRKTMAKEPAKRYQTPAEVVQALAVAGKSAVKGAPPKSSPDVPVPASKGMSDEENEDAPAETIALSPEAAQAAMRGPEAAPVAARDMLSAKTVLSDGARQVRGGHTHPPAAGKTWLIGAALAVVLLLAVGLGATLMMRNGPSKDQGTPVAQNTPPDNTKPPPPDNTRPPRPATETAETRLVANVKEVAGMDLVPIPAGEFYMGSERGDTDAFDNEKPRHKVRISGPFWLGKYKVTVGQFKRFVGATNYDTEAEKAKDKWTWRKPGYSDTGFDQTDEHPVVCVSWNDAKAYCSWVAEKTGAKVRLPREAEWEYSCRARSTTKDWVSTKYYFGNDAADLGDYAWYADNTKLYRTRPCGQKKPNAFGLYDMHGLAWEWCDDGKRTYSDDAESDPVGAGATRVSRGGSFRDVPVLPCG